MQATFNSDISYLIIALDNGNEICIPYKNVRTLYNRLKSWEQAPFKGLFHLRIESASKPLPLEFRNELFSLLKNEDNLISKIANEK